MLLAELFNTQFPFHFCSLKYELIILLLKIKNNNLVILLWWNNS